MATLFTDGPWDFESFQNEGDLCPHCQIKGPNDQTVLRAVLVDSPQEQADFALCVASREMYKSILSYLDIIDRKERWSSDLIPEAIQRLRKSVERPAQLQAEWDEHCKGNSVVAEVLS